MQRLIPVLLLVAFVFGSPYAAALLFRAMGPWEAVGFEADGGMTQMQFGADLPRPDWVPVPPGATIVHSARASSATVEGFGSLEIASRLELDRLRDFYRQEFARHGFTVDDQGFGPLNPATAAMLGIAAMLSAERAATRDQVGIHIRTSEGLIPSRLVQMNWRKVPAATAEVR